MFRFPRTWKMLSDWWEKNENDKKSFYFTIEIWLIEMQELHKQITVLSKEIKFCNSEGSLIKIDERWLLNPKLIEQQI